MAVLVFTRFDGPPWALSDESDTAPVDITLEDTNLYGDKSTPKDAPNTTNDSMNDETTQNPTAGAPSDAPNEAVGTNGTTQVTLKTNKGDIVIEMLTGEMPITAGNFVKLAQEDFYDGVKFHRVIDGFMIQGGDPLTKDESMMARWGSGGPGYSIPDEWGPKFSNTRGTISMANAGANTGGSQFFINLVDNKFLDGKHPVFGRVLSGLDVVDQIAKVETDPSDRPVEAVVIQDVVIQ